MGGVDPKPQRTSPMAEQRLMQNREWRATESNEEEIYASYSPSAKQNKNS